jgi:hypothetical protein
MWPDCSIVHGKPRHPQSQGSVERGNADIFVTCSVCANFVHELCSKACTPESVTYNLCSNEKNIISERRNASESMKRQATRMRNISERILSDVDIGTNVLIPIPNVDRGKGDPRSVLVVVINKDELGYKLGTKSGTLRGLYTGNQFELSDRKYLHIGSINNEHELSFRQAARSVLLCDGQGFARCGCSTTGKTRCNTKRCLSKKSGLLCNSRCHPNITCSNK